MEVHSLFKGGCGFCSCFLSVLTFNLIWISTLMSLIGLQGNWPGLLSQGQNWCQWEWIVCRMSDIAKRKYILWPEKMHWGLLKDKFKWKPKLLKCTDWKIIPSRKFIRLFKSSLFWYIGDKNQKSVKIQLSSFLQIKNKTIQLISLLICLSYLS